MTEQETNNKFTEQQPLRHSLADVVQNENEVRINKQYYTLLANKDAAFDVEMLKRKYDPYLNQYDYLVGDVSSEHLRLKGFYKNEAQTAVDKKAATIVDYLTEYCNPGSPYFILELKKPQHHYRQKKKHFRERRRRRDNNFKERQVHRVKMPPQKSSSRKKRWFTQAFFCYQKAERIADEKLSSFSH